jgi:hypothetical protein
LSPLADRPWLRFGVLLVLAAVPVVVYAGAVPVLIQFVNGQIADADEMNANFATVAEAVDDNDARIQVVEAIPGQSCPPGEYATGIGGGGALSCAAPPPLTTEIQSVPITQDGNYFLSCGGRQLVAGGIGPSTGASTSVCAWPGELGGLYVIIADSGGIECVVQLFDPSGPSECVCYAICQ